MTKSYLEEAIAFRKKRIASKRFPWSYINMLISLWDVDNPEKSKISKADFSYIKTIEKMQQDKLKELSPDQLKICSRIYERYQSVDIR